MNLRALASFIVIVPIAGLCCSCIRSGSSGVPSAAPGGAEQTRAESVPANGQLETKIESSNGTVGADRADAKPSTNEVAGSAQPSAPPAAEPKRADIYDTGADAAADIAAALVKAKQANRRVLVMYGGNWCGWCYKLHDVFDKNREIAAALRNEYERVMVDVGRFDKNMDIAAGYGADLKKHGVPFLTVLDANGAVVVNQDTGSLEDGSVHDVQKVKEFIGSYVAEPLDAEQVLASALARANDEGKLVLLHFGAPWCGWCHRLEEFLDANAAFFQADYVPVKVDIDRMSNGKSVAQQLRGADQGGGIPWFAILTPKGDKLITSDGPKGNIGYPAEPHEIEHFIAMLKATAQRMNADQLDQIQTILSEAAKK